MKEQTQIEEIEKPWAVYSYDAMGAWSFAKVVKETRNEAGKINLLWLKLYERGLRFSPEDQLEDEPLDPKYVKTFDNPIKVLAYFLVHQRKFMPQYHKKSILKEFLYRFPSERANLENLLAQSKSKCTSKLTMEEICDLARS